MSDEKPKNVIKPIGMTMVPFKDTPEGEVAALRTEVARLEDIVRKYEMMYGAMPDEFPLAKDASLMDIYKARKHLVPGEGVSQIRTPEGEPTQ